MEADNEYIRSSSVFQVRHLGEDRYWAQKVDVMCFNLSQINHNPCLLLRFRSSYLVLPRIYTTPRQRWNDYLTISQLKNGS